MAKTRNKLSVALILYTTIIIYDITVSVLYTSIFRNKDTVKDISSKVKEFQTLRQFRFCYMTTWNYIIQITFLVFAILDELAESLDLRIKKTLNGIRSYLFNAFVCPLTLLVVSFFWTLFNYDRHLIFPASLDYFYPMWMNHSMHTFILLPVIIELSLPKKYNFISFKKALTGVTTLVIIYTIVYHYIYFNWGVWLYPINGVLNNWGQRVILTLIQYSLIVFYLSVGVYVQNRKRTSRRSKIN